MAGTAGRAAGRDQIVRSQTLLGEHSFTQRRGVVEESLHIAESGGREISRARQLASSQVRGRAQTFSTMQAPARDEPEKGLIGRNIVVGRGLAGITQGQLARRMGIDRRQLSEWERGVCEPGLRSLRKVALALGQSLEFFVIDHDEEPPR